MFAQTRLEKTSSKPKDRRKSSVPFSLSSRSSFIFSTPKHCSSNPTLSQTRKTLIQKKSSNWTARIITPSASTASLVEPLAFVSRPPSDKCPQIPPFPSSLSSNMFYNFYEAPAAARTSTSLSSNRYGMVLSSPQRDAEKGGPKRGSPKKISPKRPTSMAATPRARIPYRPPPLPLTSPPQIYHTRSAPNTNRLPDIVSPLLNARDTSGSHQEVRTRRHGSACQPEIQSLAASPSINSRLSFIPSLCDEDLNTSSSLSPPTPSDGCSAFGLDLDFPKPPLMGSPEILGANGTPVFSEEETTAVRDYLRKRWISSTSIKALKETESFKGLGLSSTQPEIVEQHPSNDDRGYWDICDDGDFSWEAQEVENLDEDDDVSQVLRALRSGDETFSPESAWGAQEGIVPSEASSQCSVLNRVARDVSEAPHIPVLRKARSEIMPRHTPAPSVLWVTSSQSANMIIEHQNSTSTTLTVGKHCSSHISLPNTNTNPPSLGPEYDEAWAALPLDQANIRRKKTRNARPNTLMPERSSALYRLEASMAKLKGHSPHPQSAASKSAEALDVHKQRDVRGDHILPHAHPATVIDTRPKEEPPVPPRTKVPTRAQSTSNIRNPLRPSLSAGTVPRSAPPIPFEPRSFLERPPRPRPVTMMPGAGRKPTENMSGMKSFMDITEPEEHPRRSSIGRVLARAVKAGSGIVGWKKNWGRKTH